MRFTISVPDDLDVFADELAKRLQLSRSGLYATAVRQMVARHSEITAKLDAIYGRPVGTLPTVFRKLQAERLRRGRGGHAW